MSELYVSTSMGEYAIAAVMGSRRSFYHTDFGKRDLDGFFECFAKVKDEFPLSTFRKIFVEIGPGSFTGVRVGVTFARVLAQQLRIPLIAMRSLDVAAAGTAATGATAAAMLDTGNGFVYGAVYPGGVIGATANADIYAVEIDEWLDYALSLPGKLCLCGRISQRDEDILKKKNLKFLKLKATDILENMILLSAAVDNLVLAANGEAASRASEIVPIYISRKQAEAKWQEKLEDEMVKISQLVAKKEGVREDIKNLEKVKREKEQEIEDIAQLSETAAAIRGELASSMDELSILNAKRTAYTESIAAKEKKIEEYEKKLEDLKSRLRDCSRELALREAKYEKIKKLPPEIPREVEIYIQQRDELRQEVENLKEEKGNYSRQIDELATSRFEEVFERIKKEEEMLGALSDKRRRKEEEIKTLEESIKEINRKRALAEEAALETADLDAAPEEIEEPPVAVVIAPEPEAAGVPSSSSEETAEEAPPREPTPVKADEDITEEISDHTVQESSEDKTPEADEFKKMDKRLPVDPLKKMSVENLEYMVRPFGIKDLPEVMNIEEASSERPWRRQMFKEELAIPVSKLYTLSGRWQRRDKMSLMAYAVFWVVSEKAHIINFAVAPAECNKGVGSCLLYEILKKASSLGCKSAYLEVRVSGQAAHKLLEKAGFTRIAERKDYFGYPKEDAFIYERKLQ
ncbi:MAG: ribosomal protein S18-alanine N-acetyltransferase [Candidatus Omnitrophota bacterium]|nr:ribosomal-protein-alanine N-acetyltransferase [Candidatus Omnitrophota bacterium]MBU2528605.1 ribosomal protein S18-alanine N-acetyltransferase [bacterium]MBU3929765.1 ribosomal protein S18-alanine N-acetyltransferase [bacterium]MBU4123211.1 ribosomal protein S18-alanine N-acetyltransferase [bacterium]